MYSEHIHVSSILIKAQKKPSAREPSPPQHQQKRPSTVTKGKDYSFISFIHFWQHKLVLTAFILDINESYSIQAVSGFFHCKLCLWHSFIFLVFSLFSWCSAYVCYLMNFEAFIIIHDWTFTSWSWIFEKSIKLTEIRKEE